MLVHEDEVGLTVARQSKLIDEIRAHMFEFVSRLNVSAVLCVGEGVAKTNTWIGQCVLHRKLPQSVRTVVLVDLLDRGPGSFFSDPQACLATQLHIVPLLADATALPFPDRLFELTVAPFMVDDCNDHVKLIDELFRCTRKSGKVLIAGHGLDTAQLVNKSRELLGATHVNQAKPDQIRELALRGGNHLIHEFLNDHAWVQI